MLLRLILRAVFCLLIEKRNKVFLGGDAGKDLLKMEVGAE